MRKIRVLIVDDSVVIRKIVGDILAGDPDLEVAGVAANGKIALSKITQVNPDILTLDVEMPEMDGLETLAELRKTHPTLPVIMFSTLTERGGEATLEALALGANDYVTKPANVGHVSEGMQRVREQLIPKIKVLCGRKLGFSSSQLSQGTLYTRPNSSTTLPLIASKPSTPRIGFPRPPSTASGLRKDFRIVAIGVSTGGPNALEAILPRIPKDFPVPIVITQHMPPVFTRMLAERLSTKCAIPVREGVAGMKLEPGAAYLAPGDFHMTLARSGTGHVIRLNQDPHENSCRPAVDVMFRSVLENFGSQVLGVILTGMGQDGLRGCQGVKELGGQVIAQDEVTSVVWGMPGFVVKAGLADRVLPLNMIGPEIARKISEGRIHEVNAV